MNLFKLIRYFIASLLSFFRTRVIIWNYINRSGRSMFKKNIPDLDKLQEKVVEDLLSKGISLVNLDEIFPKDNMLALLHESINQDNFVGKTQPRKPFLSHYWAEPSQQEPELDIENPFIQLSLDPRILDIVNSYMKTYSKLIYFDLAKTSPIGIEKNPVASQRWHRDAGLKKIIKVFIYLNDVDEDSGPFKYVSSSHQIGSLRKLFPQKQFGRHGYYPLEGYVEKNVSENDIKCCTGRAGTVI